MSQQFVFPGSKFDASIIEYKKNKGKNPRLIMPLLYIQLYTEAIHTGIVDK